jgi:hypothetical protein
MFVSHQNAGKNRDIQIANGFEVTVVTLKNAAFWDVAPCGSCKNQRFGGALFLALRFLMMKAFLRNIGSYKSRTA